MAPPDRRRERLGSSPDRDDVIDLRDAGPGRPGPCPLCGERGYLDRIDPRAGLQLEHCPSCECRWHRSIEDPAHDVAITYVPSR